MTNEEIQQGDNIQQTNEPIYKTKSGQIVTQSQLISSKYTQDIIDRGVKDKALTLIGDTKHPDQEYKTSDNQRVSTKDLLASKYTQDVIDRGVHEGVLIPIEKKNPLQATSKGLQDGGSKSTIPTAKSIGEQFPALTEKIIMNKPGGDMLTGQQRFQKEATIRSAEIASKKIISGDQENQRIKKANALKAAAQAPSAKPKIDYLDFAKQDIINNGGGKSLQTMPSDINSLNKYFDNNANNATDYFSHRIKDVENQIKDVRTQNMTLANQREEYKKGDIGMGVQRPLTIDGKPLPQTSSKEIESNYDKINRLTEYRNNLKAAADKIASVYTATMYPEASLEEKGKIKRKLSGDQSLEEQDMYERLNIPLTDEQKLQNGYAGIDVERERLDNEYSNMPKDDSYYKRMADINDSEKALISKFPEYKKDQIGLMVAQLASDDPKLRGLVRYGIGNIDKDMVDYLSTKYDIPKSDLSGLEYGDIPANSSVVGSLAKGVYNVGAGIVSGANRIVGSALGIDPERLTYVNKGISESGNKIFGFNPSQSIEEAPTVLDTNPNSPTYLKQIQNKKAGKYNYNLASVSNALAEGIGGFAGFIGGLRGVSAAGKGLGMLAEGAAGEDAAMTSYMVISGYENNYQDADRVLGKDASEASKALFAVTKGYIDALAFKVLPKDKLFGKSAVQEAAEKELATSLAGVNIKNINRDLLESKVKKVVGGILRTAEETGHITGAMSIADASKAIVNAVLGKEGKEGEYLAEGVQAIKSTLVQTPLSMTLPLGIMEAIKYKGHSSLFKENLYSSGLKPDEYRATIQQELAKGNITEQDAKARLEVVDTMSHVVQSIPDVNPKTNVRLTHAQQVDYAYNRLKEIAAKAKSEDVKDDEALSSLYKGEAKKYADERKALLEQQAQELVDQRKGEVKIGKLEDVPELKATIDNLNEEIKLGGDKGAKAQVDLEQIQKDPVAYYEKLRDEYKASTEGLPEAETKQTIDGYNALIEKIKSIGKAEVETTDVKEIAPVETKENDTIELPAQVEGGLPRKMIFKEGSWKQQVGDNFTDVGENVKQQAQAEFDKANQPEGVVAATPSVEANKANIEKLRAEEQAELDSRIPNAEQYRVDGKVDRTKLTNEEDIKAFDEVYNKYDKLITPLLKEEKLPTPSVEVKPKVPVVKTKSQQVGEGLLTHLGVKTEVGKAAKPVKKYTSKNVDSITTEGLNKTQAKVVNDVKNVVKSISTLVGKTTGKTLEVNIHESPATYEEAVIDAGGTKQDSETKGFYLDAKGTIHLNMNKVTTDTMLHEGFHPVLDYMADNRPEIINSLHAQLAKLSGGKEVVERANRIYKSEGEVTQKKEAITDYIAQIADGTLVIDQTSFEKVKQYVVDTLNKLGFDIGRDINTIEDLRQLARVISEKFATGEAISIKDINENQNFQPIKNNGEVGDVYAAGKIDESKISDAKVMDKNPLQLSREEFKETELVKLPIKSLKEVLAPFGNRAIAINSDPSKVGKLKLLSGEEIFMYGGLNYSAIKANVEGEIGFSSTDLLKPKQIQKAIPTIFPDNNGEGLILTASQSPESMKGDAYALEYVLDALKLLPKSVLKSTEFKTEFFGKDVIAIKDAFGEKKYNDFVSKYGRADFSNEQVMRNMISDLLNNVGGNFIARNSLVSNMLAGVTKKSTRKATEGEPGYISVAPNKFISKQLLDRFDLNQEKLFYEIGEKGIVDVFMNTGEWGFVTGGFTSDSKVDYMSIQDKGIVHPQFNAKFHGKNPFILDGGYQIDKLFKPELLEKNKKGELYIDRKTGLPKPYEKKASLMVAGSMYPKGEVVPTAEKTTERLPQFSKEGKIEWEESKIGRGDRAITERDENVKNAAEDLYQGKIDLDEYNAIVDKNSPTKLVTDFIEPAKEEDIRTAVGTKSEGKVNLDFPEGKKVGVRLDIPAYINKNIWAITVHEQGANGSPLSYNNVARIKNVEFITNPAIALDIARHKELSSGGRMGKAPIARMIGEWMPIEGDTGEAKGKSAMKMVEEIKGSPEWVQIGMNPFRFSHFYDRATGTPIVKAEEIIQIGGLVYGKNVETTSKNDPRFTVKDKNGNPIIGKGGKPIQFSKEETELKQKPISSQDETVQPETKGTTGKIKINSEKVQYNGTNAIGSRERSESEQNASRNEAKEKIKNPETNASLKAANSYNKSVGLPEVTPHKYKPSDPVLQTELAKVYPNLQDVNSPTYKETNVERRIYSEYKGQHPEIFKQYDIKDYKDLVHKSYDQLIKETELQYDALPVKVTFHEKGEGNYKNNFEMLDDVHNFNHLWVYKGGADHTELGSKTADKDGLTANDKFRAVHDYYGHSVEGYQFGKDGEENAWIEHSKMFSPLAQWALSSETRGQNSWVNYSGVNDVVLQTIKTASALKKEGEKTGNKEMVNEADMLLDTVYDDFQFAEQKAIILPPKFADVSKFHTTKISEVPTKLQETNKPQFSKEEKIEGTLDGKPTTFVKHPEDLEVVNGFYSPIEKRLLETKAGNLSANKWKDVVGKGDEAKFTGVLGWLESLPPTQQVSKSEIQNWMKDNRIEISEVVLPEHKMAKTRAPIPLELSGEKSNYKEVLITLPGKNKLTELSDELVKEGFVYTPSGEIFPKTKAGLADVNNYPNGISISELPQKAKLLAEKIKKNKDIEEFKSSHYDEPNILAHIRMNTRVDAEGNKVLHIEEFQSDWGQQGKKEGFKKEFNANRYQELQKKLLQGIGKMKKEGEIAEDEMAVPYEKILTKPEVTELKELEQAKATLDKQISEAPFVTETANWTKLAWKVALKEAVKEGADKITWTTGEQQNERYNLRKQVDYVDVFTNDDGTYEINAVKGNDTISKEKSLKSSELEGLLGKDLANKIIEDAKKHTHKVGEENLLKTYRGDDLAVGGKGMIGFYGSPNEGKIGIVGDVAKSLFKQVPKTTTLQGEKPITIENTLVEKGEESYILKNENGDSLANMSFDSIGSQPDSYIHKSLVTLAKKFAKKEVQETTQHSIDITPEMKAQVEAGLPQFAKGKDQESQIKEYIDNQRKEGVSEEDIRAGIESVSDKLGLDAKKIDSLMEGEVKPAVPTAKAEPTPQPEPKKVGLSKAEIKKQVEEFDMLPASRREKITDDELDQMADDAIEAGYDVDDLVKRLRVAEYVTPNPLQVTILNKYAAALNAEQTNNPSRETLRKYTEVMDAARKAYSSAGATLRQAKRNQLVEDNVSNFLVDKEIAQGAPLSEKQMAEETAKYKELKKAKDELEAQLKIQREAYDKLAAEVGFNKARAMAKKAAKKSNTEYVEERKASVEAARAALKNLRTGQSGLNSISFGVNELMAIAPHVKDFVKSLANQGVDKLDNVITQAHAEFKDVLEGLSPKDVRNIIAGKYDEVKETRNELAAKMHLLQREAKLLNELDAARKGEDAAKTEKERVEKSRRIQELEAQIKQTREINNEDVEPIEKTNAERLATRQKQLLTKISNLTTDLKEGNFAAEKKELPPLVLDRKTIMMMDKVADLENKIRLERDKDNYEKKAAWIKGYDKIMQVLGLKRIVQTANDLSVSFRQGATLLSPTQIDVWTKSFKNQINSVFSPANYNRLMYEIRNSKDYHDMVKDGMVFNDLESVNPEQRNEEFQKSFVYKIPILKEPLLASNRAADGFLNTARYELYMKFKRNLEREGITRQSDPKAYKDAAKWAMNMTGRGNLIEALEHSKAQAVLGNTFYGAKLMASRFNLLNPNTYRKMSPAMRKEALKDITAWVGTTMAVGAALAAQGAVVSLDPDDSDFLQVKYGNKRYDISGGMVGYVRTFLRLTGAIYDRIAKSKKQADKSTEKAGKSVVKFFRNKLAPNTAYATDAFFGKGGGEEFDPYDALKIYPMYVDDVVEAYKEDGVVSLATVLLPNLIGIGYNSYEKTPSNRKERKEGKERKKRKK